MSNLVFDICFHSLWLVLLNFGLWAHVQLDSLCGNPMRSRLRVNIIREDLCLLLPGMLHGVLLTGFLRPQRQTIYTWKPEISGKADVGCTFLEGSSTKPIFPDWDIQVLLSFCVYQRSQIYIWEHYLKLGILFRSSLCFMSPYNH